MARAKQIKKKPVRRRSNRKPSLGRLSPLQRQQIEEEIEVRFGVIKSHREDVHEEISAIRVLRICLAQDDHMRLKLASSEGRLRGEPCVGLKLIRGSEKQSK